VTEADLPWTSLRSDGALNARGYAIASVRPSQPSPVPDAERVVFVDPRRTATTRASRRPSAGPRAPEQVRRPEPPPGIELPDERPLTKAQRVWIDPDLIAQWQAEDRQNASRPESGAPHD
jgi:hypothetical protein